MSQKKYIVKLTNAEVNELETVVRIGKQSVCKITRARILLLANVVKTNIDTAIAENLDINLSTAERTRKKFVQSVSFKRCSKIIVQRST